MNQFALKMRIQTDGNISIQHNSLRSHLKPKPLKLPPYHPFSPESFVDTCSASYVFSWTGLIN